MLTPLTTILPLLADVIEDAGPGPGAQSANDALLQWPSHWPLQGDLLAWCHSTGPGVATLLIIGGIVYLLFGYYIFKALVTLNSAILGAYFGAVLGDKSGTAVPAAIVGALLAAAATWPVMKYAVAVMGGLFGALLGATIWRLCDLDPHFAWSGAMTGLVFFGLLSFLLFRQCIMTYTSLQGSVMLVFGILALIFKYDSIANTINHSFELKPFLLPLSIFIPTLLGFIYQQAVFPAAAPASGPPKK
ncbi:MAG TPA: DUF4203 domain-containing protein [Tepidisphaeraceae bacterium]|nr:DUF4203 domain-containing protein [Tepidisphaeraceae bacterium]